MHFDNIEKENEPTEIAQNTVTRPMTAFKIVRFGKTRDQSCTAGKLT